MRGGYQGRILEVNLTTGRMQELPITERYAQLHIGGRGLGARLLYEHARPGVDAFDPEQPLILLTGPLTGTFYPTANRLIALGKSPLTQAYGASLAGGFFAAELKFAGYDGLIFKGAAPEPVYLSVHNGKAELLPARHLWGKLVGDTVRALRMEHGDASVRVVACGPGGENRVRYASLMAEDRAAGRTGMGALMGAKGLKAVAVRGTLPIPLHDPQGCMALMAGFQAESRSNRGMQRFITHGTAGNVKKLNIFGILPTRNFQTAAFDGAPRIDGDLLID
ncbi:MAG: aldehyde ferredoxin oxidoreductase, partial [Deltaproteobacteria bacterium]|nr:aldehyde ferredoxin oxidoreductase [Deltaproteobacteria bacterium]